MNGKQQKERLAKHVNNETPDGRRRGKEGKTESPRRKKTEGR
jgi:hypothetical protein